MYYTLIVREAFHDFSPKHNQNVLVDNIFIKTIYQLNLVLSGDCERAGMNFDTIANDLKLSFALSALISLFVLVAEKMDCPPTPPNLTAGLRSPEPAANVKMNQDPPRDTGSPEPNCTICLGPLTDQSNTDICAHKFCFNCIITWSKVKVLEF